MVPFLGKQLWRDLIPAWGTEDKFKGTLQLMGTASQDGQSLLQLSSRYRTEANFGAFHILIKML